MKPGTFTQMYVQLVFAVKNRKALLDNSIQNQVFEYIGGINTNLKHKSIIINGTSNHIHILFGLHPDVSVSDTVYNIKRGSSLFINKERLCPFNFQWQEGYGAFTYNRSDLDKIYNYIKNQQAHHEQETFMKEYMSLLEKNEIEYKPPYLFEFFDDMQ
jgi:REP element-mobilizing transposase RayT